LVKLCQKIVEVRFFEAWCIFLTAVIIRLHQVDDMQQSMSLASVSPSLSVCKSVSVSVCHVGRLCKFGWRDRRPVWGGDSIGPKKHCTVWGQVKGRSMWPLPYYFGHLLQLRKFKDFLSFISQLTAFIVSYHIINLLVCLSVCLFVCMCVCL